MKFPLAVSIGDLLIDVSLALAASVIGFVSALAYTRLTADACSDESDGSDMQRLKEEQANETERVNMAALQLRDLAKNVASDIGSHNALIHEIAADLEDLDDGAAGPGTAVVEAVGKIFAANKQLQERLEDAEQKIQAQAEEIRAQQSEARTDALTKLANRRAFDDLVESNIKLVQSEKRPFSLLLFDVDHFKKFNDAHGHQAGDEVLRSVGRALTEVVKTTDIACRYGGEEFALVMPNTKIAQAQIAAERVRKAIEAMKVEFEGNTLQVTASIGVAECAHGEDTAKLIRRSDDAVYFSKEAGRNCGHWHDGFKCRPLSEPANRGTNSKAKAASEKTPSNGGKSVRLQDLPDKMVFADELNRRVNESHRFGVSLSVMHIRVKDYVDLEQEYGDAVSQLLLESVAQFIRDSLRDMDLLAKFENGEFGVMLPGSSEREANLVGNRVRTAISNCAIPLGNEQLRLEILLGVSDVEPDDEAKDMMARAKQVVEAEQTAVTVG